ncbi:MAG: hypothetical protein RJA70_1721 [Pseudomonadota bacterium]|jgi:xylulokinase
MTAQPVQGPLFLGIDVGTSAVKVIAVDAQGEVVATATSPLALQTPKPGWAEQDPMAWWEATLAATAALVKQVSSGSIAAIGLSGQMHSSVFLDASNRVIRPAMLWCDGRTTAQCRVIESTLGTERMSRSVGNAAFEGFTLPKILWLKENEAGSYSRLAKVLLPKDFIRFMLTGQMATEPSDASGTLMFDVMKREFDAVLLKDLGLSPSLVPSVGGSSEVLGKVTAEVARLTGLPEGTPVVGGGADNACGAVGVGAVAPGQTVLSWGTSGTVLTPTTQPVVDPQLRVHTFCHAAEDTWYVMGVMLTAGGAFAWHQRELAKELEGQAPGVLSDEASKIQAGAEGLSFLPYLQGERTPHKNADARGAFIGLSLAHTRAHMTRAVLEGICFGYKDSVELLRKMGLSSDSLLVTGGGSNSPFVRSLLADILALRLRQVNKEEGPAFGAAILGAVGAGQFANTKAACASWLGYADRETPSAGSEALYASAYARFQALYPALAAVG